MDHNYEDPHVENQRFVLHYDDLTDSSNLTRILQQVQPDEVYNLGAQSHVAVSFEAGDCAAAVDARDLLPAKVETLLGEPTKAREKLGWMPEITAQAMCTEMAATGLKVAQSTAFLKAHGHEVATALEAG